MPIVELVGPSGVGKTTLSDAIADRAPTRLSSSVLQDTLLRRRYGWPATELPLPLWVPLSRLLWRCSLRESYFREGTAVHPDLLDLLAEAFRRPDIVAHLPDLLYEEIALRGLVETRTTAAETVVLDDSFYQYGVPLVVSGSTARTVVDDVPAPAALVVADAPTEECLARQDRRRRGRARVFADLPDAEALDYIDRQRDAAASLARAASDADVPVLTLELTRPIDRVAARFDDWIAERVPELGVD